LQCTDVHHLHVEAIQDFKDKLAIEKLNEELVLGRMDKRVIELQGSVQTISAREKSTYAILESISITQGKQERALGELVEAVSGLSEQRSSRQQAMSLYDEERLEDSPPHLIRSPGSSHFRSLEDEIAGASTGRLGPALEPGEELTQSESLDAAVDELMETVSKSGSSGNGDLRQQITTSESYVEEWLENSPLRGIRSLSSPSTSQSDGMISDSWTSNIVQVLREVVDFLSSFLVRYFATIPPPLRFSWSRFNIVFACTIIACVSVYLRTVLGNRTPTEIQILPFSIGEGYAIDTDS
jgi:hypothetical protein